MSRCAFVDCQAGGDILPGAPVMSELMIANGNGVVYGVREYHHGCWDAELRRTQAAS